MIKSTSSSAWEGTEHFCTRHLCFRWASDKPCLLAIDQLHEDNTLETDAVLACTFFFSSKFQFDRESELHDLSVLILFRAALVKIKSNYLFSSQITQKKAFLSPPTGVEPMTFQKPVGRSNQSYGRLVITILLLCASSVETSLYSRWTS